ncbi:valine--tRNA ligase [Sphingosinicellaceae bacterium M-36]
MHMLEKTYEPSAIEAKWYAHWEQSGAFRPTGKGDDVFTIVIPPPNVTGSLHMGHALNNTLQDVLVRYHRLKGYDVLWQPGVDHAGIATQMVVERQLDAEGLKRTDMGREQFLARVWAWKEESGGTITGQLRRLGASCDWSRERFTMDEGFSKAVLKVFVELYRQKLLYRAKRLVNWDPKLKTAISDLEVEMREVQGTFTHIRYPLADDATRHIVVATTRPETMLGDTAVAVHPDDARYQALVGKMIRHPITGRLIPIVADEWADPELGSGAVKITPAHDFNDWRVYERHKDIGYINILDADARILAADGIPADYVGLDRFEARKKVVADLEALGLIELIEPKTIQMPYGDRSGVVIEPWLTDQWYVDAKTLAEPAIAAVREGRTQFVPETWSKTYYNWMENIEPWCVSRQLWWGHQIPAWYDDAGNVYVAETAEEAQAQAGAGIALRRDEDVLDTWFSSALWPFGTLGWPEDNQILARHYPNSVLITGFDIIFFWVARMMMQGIHFMGVEPFHTVYCHGLVRDEKGQKMSKSKGNVIDPLTLIDKYGADALRFFMCAMESQGRDIKLSEARIQGYRNFGTKLWNAARFCQMNGVSGSASATPPAAHQTVNRWIIGEVAATVAKVEAAYAAYRFDDIANTLYGFVWNSFCDWYVELSKPALQGEDGPAKAETQAVAGWVIDQILVLLHPVMPFLTEELWHALADRTSDLITARWPVVPADVVDATAVAEVDWLVRLISAIRSARTELNVPPSAQIGAHVAGASAETAARLERHQAALLRLARLSGVSTAPVDTQGAIQVVVDEATFVLPVADLIDLAAEKARLAKSAEKARKEAAGIAGRLGNAQFIEKAKPEVVEDAREKLAELTAQADRLDAALNALG